MNIKQAINKAEKQGLNVVFNKTNHAYEAEKNGVVFSFQPNGRNESETEAYPFAVRLNKNDRVFSHETFNKCFRSFKNHLNAN